MTSETEVPPEAPGAPHLRNPFPVLGGAAAVTLSIVLLVCWVLEHPVQLYTIRYADQLDALLAGQCLLIGIGILLLPRSDMRVVINGLFGILLLVAAILMVQLLRAQSDTAMAALGLIANLAAGLALVLAANSPDNRKAPFLVALSTLALLLAGTQALGGGAGLGQAGLAMTAPYVWFAQLSIGISLLTIAVLWNLEIENRSPWLPALAGYLIFAVALGFWSVLSLERHEQNRRTFQLGAQGFQAELFGRIETSTRPLFELAELWKISGLVDLAEWNRIALRKVEKNPALEALLWIDPAHRIRLVSSLSAHQEKQGMDLNKFSVLTDLLVGAEVSRSVMVTAAAPNVHGASAFIAVLPILTRQSFSGYVAGIVSLETLVEKIREREIWDGYALEIRSDNVTVLRHAQDDTYRRDWSEIIPADHFSSNWEVVVWPEEQRMRGLYSPIPEGVLAAGMIIALLTTGMLMLFQISQARSQRLRRMNRSLAAEVETRQWLQNDLVQTNVKLHAQNERLQSVMDHATDAILTINQQGFLEGVNRAAEKHFGYSHRDFVGRHATVLLSRKYWPAAEEALSKLRGSNDVPPELIEREVRLRRADSSSFYARFTVSRVVDNESKQYYIVFITDITRQRESEEALKRARKAAELANEQKSSFLANMSHEIRTPMNGIIGMSALMQDTELSTLQKDYLRTIQGSAESLLGIINDILDFSKVEAGRLQLETIEFNLRSDLEDLIDLLGLLAREKGLVLQLRYKPGTPLHFRGDPVRIRQIVTNFVNNAIKFTRQGHVLIEVSAESQSASRAEVHFRVEDTGIGIPPEKFADIFRDFTQADVSTTREYGGTGLGLTIAKRLTEMMNGRISVDSIPGTGTTFDIMIDLEVVEKAAYRANTREFSGQRALVVDAIELTRTISCEQLSSWGIETDEYQHPQRALAALEHAVSDGAPYSLVLFEKRYPDGSGVEFARAVRANPKLAGTRLLMLTSQPEIGDGQRARELQIDGYLPRPCHEEDLQGVIRKLLIPGGADPGLVTRLSVAEERTQQQSTPEHKMLSASVLLVEDNLVNQKVAKKMLEKLGCTVDIAKDGREGVEFWRSKRYDLILMDCQMPGMDGYEATRIIRREEGDKQGHIPILALTANAMSQDREQCLKAGMDDHIPKPVKLTTLAEAIDRHLTVH